MRPGVAHAISYTLDDYFIAREYETYLQKMIEAETIWRRIGRSIQVSLFTVIVNRV